MKIIIICGTAREGPELAYKVGNSSVFAFQHDVDIIFNVQSSSSLWQQVRQKVIRGSYDVAKSRYSPDQSENRSDVANVDMELM